MSSFFSSRYLGDQQPSPLSLRSGVDYTTEADADRLLAKGREGVTALSDKHDFLTRDQLILRMKKEVLNSQGFADESLYPGLFRRAFNPLAGKRPSRRSSDDG